jgi:hypothetical protein
MNLIPFYKFLQYFFIRLYYTKWLNQADKAEAEVKDNPKADNREVETSRELENSREADSREADSREADNSREILLKEVRAEELRGLLTLL